LPKGYIYAAIAFSVAVEALNQLAARRRKRPVAVAAPQAGTVPDTDKGV